MGVSHYTNEDLSREIVGSWATVLSIRADKIASSTSNLGLTHQLMVATELPPCTSPRAGDVVVARALTESATYDKIELVSGRMAKVNPGDIIAGVLGRRRALKGFVGDVPESLRAGDRLHLLNLGGLIGSCLGRHHSLGSPIEVEVIGAAIRDARVLNISEGAVAAIRSLDISTPLILIAGTCMHSGKTYAAAQIIKYLTRSGVRVAAAKLSGVACLRDTLNMEDHGAIRTLSFLDCGLPSTVGVTDLACYAKGIINQLEGLDPDCIVIELGDGIMGGYGVSTIFDDGEITRATAALVFSANDFVGVWGGRELLGHSGIRIDVVTGPVTDSQMGVQYVEKDLGLAAANAIHDGERLASIVKERIEKWSR